MPLSAHPTVEKKTTASVLGFQVLASFLAPGWFFFGLLVWGKMTTENLIGRVLLVGDSAVGKTCFLITLTHGEFPSEYVPTVSDAHLLKEPLAGGETLSVELEDTGSRGDYDVLRVKRYPGVAAVLVFFSVVKPDTFERVESYWWPEIQLHAAPGIPTVLVGTKIDLREDPEVRGKEFGIVSRRDARATARRLGSLSYLEISALKQLGLSAVIQATIKAIRSASPSSPSSPSSHSNRCLLL